MCIFFALVLMVFISACSEQHYFMLLEALEATQIDEDSYEIVARGDFGISRKDSEALAVLKAAETTVENGKEQFKITDAKIEQYTHTYVLTRVRWWVTINIDVALASDLPAGQEGYKDARAIIAKLGPRLAHLRNQRHNQVPTAESGQPQ